MTQQHIYFFCFLLTAATLSCGKKNTSAGAESLQDKAAPYDLFSFQRSYPDRDFDWRGWRKYMSNLRLEFVKKHGKDQPDNNSADWALQGPGNVAGRVNAIAIKPGSDSTLLAGFSGGGIFKSTDAGNNWKPVFDNELELSIGDITYDPNNPNIVYAGTGDPNMPAITFNGNGLYKSTDGGETWQYLGLGQEGIISKILVDPSNSSILYAGIMGNPYVRDEARGVYKSTDGGVTWQKVLFVSNQAGTSDLVMDPVNPKILYASFWDRIRNNQESLIYGPHARVYKTTDGGATWNQLGGGLPTGVMGRTGLAISQQNPNKLYAVYIDSLSTPGGLYKSTDGGATWTSMNIVALEDACADFGWYFGKIRVNPVNDEEVYFLAIILYRKAAGSTQWQPGANSHADVHDLQFGANGLRYLGCDGGVYRNKPGQMQWIKSNNLPTTQFYHTSYNPHTPDVYYAGAQDNGIRKGNGTLYNGWESVFPADGFRCAFHPADPNLFWVETQNGEIHKTIDGGNNWSFGEPCLGTTDRCNWDLPYLMSPHNPDRLYAGTYRMYFSESGSGWGPISGDLTDGVIFAPRFHNISCLDESPVLAEKLIAGTSDGNVWRAEPKGNWVNITAGLPERYVTAVIGSPTLSNRIFVTHSGFRDNEYIPHIHRSDNNGQTWINISGNLPNVPVNDLYVLPGHADSVLFAATDAGVYVTLNSGQQWQRLGVNLPFVPVFDLERNPVRNELIAATHARGLYTYPIDSVFSIMPPGNATLFAGVIKTEAGLGIDKVTVCNQPLQTTDADGEYAILFGAPCLTSGIRPLRNDDPLNGVSTFDLVLINKHILGLDTLDSPFKIIAADANKSRTITTFDIVALRKVILGIDTVFPNSNSWRFIPTDYNFPNALNPFSTIFPEEATPALPAQAPAQPIAVNFTGLKVGDVNASATPAFSGQVQERWKGTWPLTLEEKTFRAGETLEVVFSAAFEKMAGAQFTISYQSQTLDLQRIEPLNPAIGPDNFGIKPGGKNCFTACFENPAGFYPKQSAAQNGNSELFRVVFRAKRSGQLSQYLHTSAYPTPAAAFGPDGTAYEPVLNWGVKPLPKLEVLAYPNPAGSEGVWFNVRTAGPTNAVLRIFDSNGKLLFDAPVDQPQVKVAPGIFNQNGVYWYEVRQGQNRASGKLLFTGN